MPEDMPFDGREEREIDRIARTLLREMEHEKIPAPILDLARQLQDALRERARQHDAQGLP